MEIVIREYRESDSEACNSLYAELTRHHAEIYGDPTISGTDPGRGFRPYMENPRRHGTWVAEVEGKVVGMAGLLVHSKDEAEVEPVVVTAAHRSRGIGSLLVDRVVEETRKTGIRFLSIRPVVRNERALSLYVRLGFDTIGFIDLLQDLSNRYDRKWKPGIEIHGNKLRY